MRQKKRTDSGVCRYMAALLEGLLWTVPFAVLAVFLVLWMGRLPGMVMDILTGLGWCTAAFVSSRRAGLRGRHHGIRTGILCGSILWTVRLCGAVLLGASVTAGTLLYLLLLLPTGAVGGVIGVNMRIKAI